MITKLGDILETGDDQEILAWAERCSTDLYDGAAIVLASDYSSVKTSQEIVPISYRSHPKRPVLMRGSRYALAARWARKSDHACDVAERYLRAKKFNDFDRQAEYGELIRLLRRRFPPRIATHAITSIRPGQMDAWVNGKRATFGDDERKAIQAIGAVIGRITRLEARHA